MTSGGTTITPVTNTNLTHLRVEVDGGVATVTIDRKGESLNTLDPSLMKDFETVLERLETDADVRAVVIISAKADNFVAGANIKWFAELTHETAVTAIRQGHDLFDRLEALHTQRGKPVVAAIHGACLGGGAELALACSHRIITDDPKTQMGQPEVQLGVLPAGGATQRLPDLIGIEPALGLILTGKPVRAAKAVKLGLADERVPKSMLATIATERALAAVGEDRDDTPGWKQWLSPTGLQKLALETNPVGLNILFKQARQRVLAETGGNYPAPLRALEAVEIGAREGRKAGLAAEAKFFGELVVSPESKALRSIFFATRSGPDTTDAREVSMVGVVGGGLMGAGIATVSTQRARTRVRIKEMDADGVARARAYVSKVLAGRVKKRRMTPFESERAMLRVTGTTDWSGFANADLVVEAVFEDLGVKRDVLREVEGVVGPETVFASNTSSLPISAIAEASSRAETVLGMHYFSPVEKMPLLEVVVTPETAKSAEATAVAFGQKQGKTVIVVNDGTGFYTSRILGPYTAEAFHLLAEGARIEDIDEAIESWGFPVGPLRLADEVGLDVGAKIGVILTEAFGERMAMPDSMAGLETADRKGRKNRRGFYTYDSDGVRGGPDDTVYADLGVTPTGAIAPTEIQERVTLAMINEAARCLEENILRSAEDGDVGAVMGLGFPPFRGGPFFWIDEMGADQIVSKLRRLSERHGSRFDPADILVEAANENRRFRG